MIKPKKFLNKILPLVLFLSIFSQTIVGLKVFAYSGGLLDGKVLMMSDRVSTGGVTITEVTDNNISTTKSFGSLYKYIYYTFSNAVNISAYQLNANSGHTYSINIVHSNGTTQSITTNADFTGVRQITTIFSDVKTVYISSSDNAGVVKEFDVFGGVPIIHDEVSGLMSSYTSSSVSLNWVNPASNPYFTGVNIYRNGALIAEGIKATNYTDSNLEQYTTFAYKITAKYSDGFETSGQTLTTTTSIFHDEVKNLLVDANTFDSVNINWEIPTNPYLIGFNVYRENILIKKLGNNTNTFKDTGLNEDTSYTYKIKAIYYDGVESSGLSKSVTTPLNPIVKNVSNAAAAAVSYKRVNISWALPDQNKFHHVNIYRLEKPKEQGFFQSIFSGIIANAAEEPTKIFETNGTYFNDLTVKPDTNYEYTLTTQTDDGRESDGLTVTAETPSEPTPVLKTDGDYTVNHEGSYVFKWTEPTVGKVKILINGKDYKIVDASLKQITIPKTDMKTNTWGDPSISMIPVGEFGTEGKEVFIGNNSFLKNLKLPFQSSDLLTTSIGILGLVAPIILLTLVIYYFKPIKRVIVNAALKIKERRELKRE